MFRKVLSLMLLFTFVLVSTTPLAWADERDDQIQLLKRQVQDLMNRIEKLEKEGLRTKDQVKEEVKEEIKKAQAAPAGRVDLANILSKLKIKGRIAAGYLQSGNDGSYAGGAFAAPDAKIQLAFQPDEINTVVARFNVNNATAQNPLMDYLFLQSKDFLPFLKNTPFSLSGRLGRFKLGFGEETWSDNPVEGVLPSNSAARTTVTDEAFELAGKIDLAKIGLKPLGWVASISNGTTGLGTDSGFAKAVMAKVYYTPINPLYLSASYYYSGDLKNNTSEFSIAGLATRANTTNWQRQVWEVDARYDFGKGKKPLDPPAYSDSKAIVRVSYGAFDDSTTNRGSNKLAGNFGFVEGTYNLTKKIYTAARASFVHLYDDKTATLNSVTANEYQRYSLGLGYRWSENSIIKTSYDWNRNLRADDIPNNANDNLISVLVASQF